MAPLIEVLPPTSGQKHKGSHITPGWAYVPDTGIDPAKAALQPSARKRGRDGAPVAQANLSARQSRKVNQRLVLLDKENHRDAAGGGGSGSATGIQVPVRMRDAAGRVSKGKVTPGVRKILMSQKTFSNYLADEEALGPAHPTAQAASQLQPPSSNTMPPPPAPSKPTPAPPKPQPQRIPTHPPPYPHPAPPPVDPDADPLLISQVPAAPTKAQLLVLISGPPLTYKEAGAAPKRGVGRRRFCEVCGHWGKVRCVACGGCVCGLACLEVHREGCGSF